MGQTDWSGTCKLLSDDTVCTVSTETAIINKHEGQKGTDRHAAAADTGKALRNLELINQKHKLKGALRLVGRATPLTELQY